MPVAADKKIESIGLVLKDQKRPLKERFRALFTLRNIGGPVARKCIEECFDDPSALLKHELAYCLGQLQDNSAIPKLKSILQDERQEPMVRHEAAEALGAIAAPDVKELLEEYANDPITEVAETCQLALDRIKWLSENAETKNLVENPYASVDPAPPAQETDVVKLKHLLLDSSRSLFDRYTAMFALRNLNTEDSIHALGEGLKATSALFRHEVAFVMGQLQQESGIPYLQASLEDVTENEMVRHECAEALGAIASPICYDILKKYMDDDKRVVKESCEIALDMCEYENSPEFQYADTLLKV